MELKVKGKFVTSSKMINFQNPSCHILNKINETYDKKNVGYHDGLKIYGAPNLCTVSSKMTSFPPSEGVSKSPSLHLILVLYGSRH